jgi:hypothetical protein
VLIGLIAVAELLGLTGRDRRFFELAVTLIPIFFLTGAVASAARVPRGKVWPRDSHMFGIGLLLLFVLIEVNAELRGIEALVGGNVSNFDRYLVLTGLVLAIFGAAASLIAPWVRHFYRSGPGLRQIGITLGVGGLLFIGTIGWGTYKVFGSIFELTKIEKSLRREERLSDLVHDAGQTFHLNSSENKQLLRLHIRYAHLCRLKHTRALLAEEQLTLRLVQIELAEFVLKHNLIDKLGEKKGTLGWLTPSSC